MKNLAVALSSLALFLCCASSQADSLRDIYELALKNDALIKAEEAVLSMDFLLEIRNKLVNAYNDIMRMPI